MDILLYDNLSLHTATLILPHPGIAERAFVVLPLADLAPDLRLPDGRTLVELRDSGAIRAQTIARVERSLT